MAEIYISLCFIFIIICNALMNHNSRGQKSKVTTMTLEPCWRPVVTPPF